MLPSRCPEEPLRRRPGSHLPWILALAVCAGACEEPPVSDVDVEHRSGTRTTTLASSPFETDRYWTLASEPRVSIGVAAGDPAEELNDVVAARRMLDGSVVVANAGSGEVRLYDHTGSFVRSIGRAGEGPGEFRRIGWLQVIEPDTLVVLDIEGWRLSAFTTLGTLQWGHQLEGRGYPLAGEPRLGDGTSVIFWQTNDTWSQIRAGELAAGRTHRSTAVLARHDPAGKLLDTLGVFPGLEQAVLRGAGAPSTRYPPWGRMTVFAPADSLIWVGTQEEATLEALDLEGRVRERIRWPADLTLDDRDVEAFAQAEIDVRNANAEAGRSIRARWADVARPPSLPAYGLVRVGDGGRLWVSERFPPLVSPRRWVILEPGGNVVAQVIMPDRFDVHEVGSDYVLGRSTDALGVERVQLYDLLRN